jgi:hypothetical protein
MMKVGYFLRNCILQVVKRVNLSCSSLGMTRRETVKLDIDDFDEIRVLGHLALL